MHTLQTNTKILTMETAGAQQKKQTDLTIHLARALWRERLTEHGRNLSPDQRKIDWQNERTNYIRQARRIARQLQRTGVHLYSDDGAQL